MSACRGCGAEMTWGVHEANGKGVPLDPGHVDDGNLVQVRVDEQGRPVVRYVRKGEDTGLMPRYKTHFATCPKTDEFRKDR